MPVDTQHPEYKAAKIMRKTMRDSIAGEDAIKAAKTEYLPAPEDTLADSVRYKNYVLRANYVPYTERTLDGLNGAIFRKDPTFTLPSSIEYMKDDSDGSGLNLDQLAKEINQEVLGQGRVGILLDRPVSVPGATKEDEIRQKVRANISVYYDENIINWKETKTRGASVLTKVVLTENIEVAIDEFESDIKVQYRVLALDDSGNYYQRIYNDGLVLVETIYPTNESGNLWSYIPFYFIGAKNNKPGVNKSPLYGMAKVNLSHYRNSADYEEGVYMFGQPTPWVSSNMSNDQWQKSNPNGVKVGSRSGVFVGEGGQLGLATMQPNSAAKEAMDQKESQMVAIGAKIIQSNASNETAETARINASSENSILNTIVGNQEDAMKNILRAACDFEGGNPDEVEVVLNRDFFPFTMTAQQVASFLMLADRGDIAQSDVREMMRKIEYLRSDRTDEDIDSEIGESGI